MPTQREVTIWAPYASVLEQQTLQENQDLVREVNFVWYTLEPDGVIQGAVQSPQALEKARSAGLRVVPSIANAGFSRDNVMAAIGDPAKRTEHVQAIVQLVLENGYDGIDIDYESLAAEDREPFTRFIEELAVALHAEDKLLSIAVHAKTDDAGSWSGPAAQDWARLGAAVDLFKIMTYDYHWATSEAGPLAPLDWVDQVLTYAATVVPPAKTYVGLPFYGYDWVGQSARDYVWRDTVKLVEQEGVTVQRDPTSGEAWFTYDDDRHTVYFVDAAAVQAKLEFIFARHPELAGVAIWRLGGEDPGNWTEFRSLLR